MVAVNKITFLLINVSFYLYLPLSLFCLKKSMVLLSMELKAIASGDRLTHIVFSHLFQKKLLAFCFDFPSWRNIMGVVPLSFVRCINQLSFCARQNSTTEKEKRTKYERTLEVGRVGLRKKRAFFPFFLFWPPVHVSRTLSYLIENRMALVGSGS